nr:hypothetical protein [Clostridia bacterium]
MKKFVALLLALLMVLPMAAMAEAVPSPSAADVFTSASTANYYGDFALTGDELMEAANSQNGFYLIVTVNPDGSANAGVFIFAVKKLNDKYYIQLGLAENQTKANLEATGKGLAIYAVMTADKPYAVSGARFYFEEIADQAIVDELMKDARQGAMFFEVTEVLPLG